MIKQNKGTNNRVLIIVPLLFALVITFFIQSRIANNSFLTTMQILSKEDLKNVYFYKDYIRDSEGLEIFIDDPVLLESFTNNLNNIERTSTAVKTVKVEKSVKIKMYIGGEYNKEVQLNIMKTFDLGENALISTSLVSRNFSSDRGNYISEGLLSWLEDLSRNPEYERIWEKYY